MKLTNDKFKEEESNIDAEENDHLGGLGDGHDVAGCRADRATRSVGTAVERVKKPSWVEM